MKGPRKTLLASSILAIPSLAQALGLGGIEVKSGLNEPLNAEIQVIQSAPGEADGLAVALASAEDFARVGIDRARMEMPLTFTVSKGAAGQAVIKVTSAVPVKEPFLNFLLEVNWSKGRLLREYTVLLDPPVSAPARGSQVATAPVRDTAPVTPVAAEPAPKPAEPAPKPAEPVAPPPVASEPPKAPAEPQPAPAPAPVAAEAPPSAAPEPAGDYGPIGQGETLWEIAQATRPEGVADNNKFMIALLRMNPNAFYEQNINALKRGAILRIPTSDEVNAIAASEAAEAVRGQNELWRGYQSSQSAAPTTLADAGASESLRTPPATTSSSGSRLELLPPRAGEDQGAADRPGNAALERSGEEIKNLRGDLARANEDLESSRQEVSELRSRVTDLEKIKSDQDKVLSLKNDELKTLQSRASELEKRIRELEATAAAAQAAADKAQADAAAAAATAAAQPEPAPADIWKPEDQPPADTTPPVDTAAEPPADTSATPPVDTSEPVAGTEPPADTTTPADTTPEPAPVDAAPVPSDTAASTQPVPEPAPVEPQPVPAEPAAAESSGGMFSNPWVLGGIGAAALALIGLLFARRRKKEEPAPDFGGGDSAADDHGGYFPAERAPAAVADVGDAEEEALLDQVAMNPSDLRVRLNLLRLYARHGNAPAFEEAARALRAQIASEDQPEWQEAAQIAAGIVPGHPLFQHKDEFPSDVTFEEPEARSAESVESSFDLNAFDETPAQPAPVSQPALQAAAEPSFDFDFDLDAPTQAIEPVKAVPAPAPAPEPAPVQSDELSFDFDLDVPAPAQVAAPVAQPEPIAAAPAPTPVKEEFSLDLPEIDFAAVEAPKLEVPKVAEPAAPSMDDELGDLGVFGDDAVATKLDLARAYMDMGDPDGARSMLEEVIGEGNAAQQDEARKLLGSLG